MGKEKLSENVQAAFDLMTKYYQTLESPSVEINNLDANSCQDRHIVLQIMLRGKTVEDYFNIVNGLMKASADSKDINERKRYNNLSAEIMTIGESNLGIDWS